MFIILQQSNLLRVEVDDRDGYIVAIQTHHILRQRQIIRDL